MLSECVGVRHSSVGFRRRKGKHEASAVKLRFAVSAFSSSFLLACDLGEAGITNPQEITRSKRRHETSRVAVPVDFVCFVVIFPCIC